MKKEVVACISRVGATEGGTVITWSVFLRHPCPRSPTAEPGPSTHFFAGCTHSHCQVGTWHSGETKLLAKIKFTRRVSAAGIYLTGLWPRAAYVCVSGSCSSCTDSVLWKVAMHKMQTAAVGCLYLALFQTMSVTLHVPAVLRNRGNFCLAL